MSVRPRWTSAKLPSWTRAGVRRGELWRSPSSIRDRVVLLVSSQTLIDLGSTMLYAVEADAEDPGPLLLIIPIATAGQQRWLNIQRGLTRVYRGTLTESYG